MSSNAKRLTWNWSDMKTEHGKVARHFKPWIGKWYWGRTSKAYVHVHEFDFVLARNSVNSLQVDQCLHPCTRRVCRPCWRQIHAISTRAHSNKSDWKLKMAPGRPEIKTDDSFCLRGWRKGKGSSGKWREEAGGNLRTCCRGGGR